MAASERATVLIVDDEASIAEGYVASIREEYDLLTATSRRSATELLDSRVDVALVGRRLPDGRGEAVLKRIREQELECRVALLSAAEPTTDGSKSGFDAHLCKPVTEAELHETVEALLRRSEYDSCMREYFALLSRQAALQTERSKMDLAASAEYQRLTERVVQLRTRSRQILDTFDRRDFRAAFQDISDDTTDAADSSDARERSEEIDD
mgnify:FL=1